MSSFNESTARSSGLGVRDYVLLLLILCAIGGIAIMDFSDSGGFWYWMAMVPVFGGLSIFMEWYGRRQSADARPLHVRGQALHWLATLLGVGLVFLLHGDGMLDRTTTGMMALLVLGLSTLQAGLQTNWRLALLGVLLLATLAAAVAAERYFWLMLVLALIVLAIFRLRRS
jgi:hypothetical protein